MAGFVSSHRGHALSRPDREHLTEPRYVRWMLTAGALAFLALFLSCLW